MIVGTINAMLVTYEGTLVCEIDEEDIDRLEIKEPGHYVTIFNVMSVDEEGTPDEDTLEIEKEIETCTIVSRLA